MNLLISDLYLITVIAYNCKMKRVTLFFLLLTILSSSHGNAQVTRPPHFDTCQYLQSLQGEWMNVNGNDTIRVYLRFHRDFYSDPETYNSTVDELWGWVEYKQGSNIIMSDYANRFATLPYNVDDLTPGLRSIVIWPGKGGGVVIPVGYDPCTNPITDITGKITDRVRCNLDKNISATVNLAGTQMSWHIVQPTALLDSAWCAGYTLPQQFTLIKQ